VSYLALLLPLPFISPTVFLLASVPFLMYVFLAIYVSANVVSEDKKVNFMDVLITFPLLHISYGLGYLKGIFEFMLMNKKPSDKQKRLSR
jgi:hypothetical protein